MLILQIKRIKLVDIAIFLAIYLTTSYNYN